MINIIVVLFDDVHVTVYKFLDDHESKTSLDINNAFRQKNGLLQINFSKIEMNCLISSSVLFTLQLKYK